MAEALSIVASIMLTVLRIKSTSAVLELSSLDFFLICLPLSCSNVWITNIVLKIVD